jgi:long-chain acyl-CoA synthetase
MSSKASTICDHVLNMKDRSRDSIAIKYKREGQWRTLSWPEYYERIVTVASSLLAYGIKPGARVAIMANTRIEWSIADYAIMGIQAITVPIYQTVTAEDLKFILNNCEAEFIFVENKSLLKLLKSVMPECPSIKRVVTIESTPETGKDILNWADFYAYGTQEKDTQEAEFQKLGRASQLKDPATILYTSGTTGQPKGVVLCHEQIMSEVTEAFPFMGAQQTDTSLTFLPYAHILGRIEHWGHVYIGFTLAFAESIERVKQNLVDIEPDFLIAVPRIFEKIYSGIYAQMEGNVVKGNLFKWAMQVGLKAGDYRLKREPLPLKLALEYALAQKLVLSKIKQAFGGKIRFCVSGGAPMARDIALFFHACDILILEGYGLTETTAAICVNTPYSYRFGSVGKPIGDVELKIAADGEILVRSKKVMREYYKNPEATQQSFTDGWFHTGDIGEVMPSGDLKITDRKKDLIKTAGGKYVAPQRLENLLKANTFVSNVLIHGDQKKYIVALITLDVSFLYSFAKDKGIDHSNAAALTQHPQILEVVRKGVAETNTHLASYESIKRFAVLPSDFTVESGELTPSLKVKRKVLDAKYRDQIASLYS